MPASTEMPRFGEVWRYTGSGGAGSLYMLVAPDDAGSAYSLGYWQVLYLGAALMEARIREGRSVLDRMAGLPGPQDYRDVNWERVS